MKQALALHQFHRAVEDELAWVREAETLLSNEDIGKDLQGVRFLLKNHQVRILDQHNVTAITRSPGVIINICFKSVK